MTPHRAVRLAAAALWLSGIALLSAPAASADVGLDRLLAESGATLCWDAAGGRGVIELSGNQIAFASGVSWGLVNYRARIAIGPVTRASDGSIRFTDKGRTAIEAALRASPPPARTAPRGAGAKPRIAAIIIDPGHGGRDPGTSHEQTIGGKKVDVVEKDIVLKIGKGLYAGLRARYPDKRILITRSEDSYLSLEQRTDAANSVPLAENEAEIYVSIHANASLNPASKGYEVWYLPPTFRRNVLDDKALARGQNDLYPILNSMREEEYTIESVLLGKNILSGIQSAVGDGEVDRGLKAESWFVVRNSKMPAVLVEVGFVTNAQEAARLHDDAYLKKLEEGLYNGISNFVNYFDNLSGFQE
jgi:N-acetylmuramoyl-L-alanine amidase